MKFLTTALDRIPWVNHGFFTRQGGVSDGIYASLNAGPGSGDTRENVQSNRDKIAEMLEVAPQSLLSVKQIHSATAVTIQKPWKEDQRPDGDAMVTDRPGVALGILTADCVPVLFASRRNRIIGAAHAGWGGALKGILDATVAGMKKLGADEIEAAIGPCIRGDSYEVSTGFEKPFIEQSADNEKFFRAGARDGKLMFDLAGYVAKRLQGLGIKKIYDTRQDTLPNESVYYSYRRTTLRGEKDYGRQMSAIALKNDDEG